MKETFYFSHDFHARSDEKILKLLQKEKWEWYGLYWAIVEKLYEAGGIISEDYDVLAYDLRTDNEKIYSIVNNFDLFDIEDGTITSHSVKNRILKRAEKSETARENIMKRWGNDPGRDKAKKQIFYVIEIFNENERFIKCGITSNSVNRRYSGKLWSYQFVILSQIDVEVSQAIECERHITTIAKRYTPNNQFWWYLECFSIDNKAEILDFVIQCEYNGNTIKERKGKEIKIKEKKEKEEIRALVFLTKEETEKIKILYGPRYDEAIDKLSNYKNAKGTKYKSDYHVLIGWVYEALLEKYPDLWKAKVEVEKIKKEETKQKEAEKKEKQDKIEAEKRVKELESYYRSLPKSLQEEITARAENAFIHISDEARKKYPENYKNFVQGKRRSITEYYKNKWSLPTS